MKKYLIFILATIMIAMLTGCETKDNSSKQAESEVLQKEETDSNNNYQKNNDYDDEIIEYDDEDNEPFEEEKVVIEKVINCDGCVYAYFSNEKSLGDALSETEYTNDVTKLKTSGGKQRHNFFGLILNGNKISRAYACILKDNKIYCLEGSINGAYHTNNIGVLNQVFTTGQCKYISDGHNYVCTDGSYNGNTKTSGYTSMHYETSCTIYGANAKTGKIVCN